MVSGLVMINVMDELNVVTMRLLQEPCGPLEIYVLFQLLSLLALDLECLFGELLICWLAGQVEG